MGRIGVALVTGVSGHPAGVMADRLRAGGLEVRALVRTPDQAEAAAQRRLVLVPGDLTAPESLRPAVAGVSVVVHAAAYVGADPGPAGQVNVAGTRWLAEASLHAGIERFVHVSSMSVHGEPQPDGLREDSPLRPDAAHPYVASKAWAELELTAARSRGLPVVILRPGAIWRRHQVPVGRRAGRPAARNRLAPRSPPRRCHPVGPRPGPGRDDLAGGHLPGRGRAGLPGRRPQRHSRRVLRPQSPPVTTAMASPDGSCHSPRGSASSSVAICAAQASMAGQSRKSPAGRAARAAGMCCTSRSPRPAGGASGS